MQQSNTHVKYRCSEITIIKFRITRKEGYTISRYQHEARPGLLTNVCTKISAKQLRIAEGVYEEQCLVKMLLRLLKSYVYFLYHDTISDAVCLAVMFSGSGLVLECGHEGHFLIWQEKLEQAANRFFFELVLNEDILGNCFRVLGKGFQCCNAVNFMDRVL